MTIATSPAARSDLTSTRTGRTRDPAAALAVTSAAVALALLSGAGCGNYSNEDLEFMSAVPQRQDVAVEVPRRASLDATGFAEGWKSTLEVTRAFNGVADSFLSLIEKVRSYYPSARKPNQRIWGPFPSDDHPGWLVEFRMTKGGDLPTPSFDYVLVMIAPEDVVLPMGATETSIIRGVFDAAGGVRVGLGHLEVTPEVARGAGVQFSGLEKLRTLAIDYDTRDWPRRVSMLVRNLPPSPSDPATDPAEASYAYERAENGDGGMRFTVLKDVIDGAAGTPPQDETLTIESRWLGSGQGRADVAVTGGDSTGAPKSLECWDERFHQTYQIQTWVNAPVGDAESCIPKL